MTVECFARRDLQNAQCCWRYACHEQISFALHNSDDAQHRLYHFLTVPENALTFYLGIEGAEPEGTSARDKGINLAAG